MILFNRRLLKKETDAILRNILSCLYNAPVVFSLFLKYHKRQNDKNNNFTTF